MMKKIWKWLDGKKRIIGIGLTYIGKAMQKDESMVFWGQFVEYLGLAIAGGGVIHAIKKYGDGK